MRATVEDEAVTTLVHDRRLLKRYVRDGSEDAFHEIVRRHIRLVYATCLRELGDPGLAEDATQIVFLILSRKAPALSLNQSLAGWLFITARYTAIDLRRRELRRREIESEVEKQARDSIRYDEFAWGFIDPNLNDALMSLGHTDRQAVLLRFFEQQTFKEVGQHLSLTEAAAERRVSRALVKMRRQMVNAGFAVSISALFALLQERAADAVPAQCLTKTLQIASATKHATSVALLAKSAAIAHKMNAAARIARLKLVVCLSASLIVLVASEQVAAHYAHRASTAVAGPVRQTASIAVLSSAVGIAPTRTLAASIRTKPKPRKTPAAHRTNSPALDTAPSTSTSTSDPVTNMSPSVSVSGRVVPDRLTGGGPNKAQPVAVSAPVTSATADMPVFAPDGDSKPHSYRVVAIPDNDPQSLNYEFRHSGYALPAADLDLPVSINNNDEILYRCGDVYRWDGDNLDFEHRTYGLPEVHPKQHASTHLTPAMEAIYEQLHENGGKMITRTNGQVTSEVDVPPAGVQSDESDSDTDAPPTYEPAIAASINDSGDILGICASGVFVSGAHGLAYPVLQIPSRLNDASIFNFDFRGRITNDGEVEANVATVPSEYRELSTNALNREASFAWHGNSLESLAAVLDRQLSPTVVDVNTNTGDAHENFFTQSGIYGEPLRGGSAFQFGDVNADGASVGVLWGTEHVAICWSNGRVFRLPGLPQFVNAPMAPRGINNSNEIVGYAGVGQSRIGVIWRHGKAYDLNELSHRSEWHITRALGINDRGEIVALGRHGAFNCPVILIPANVEEANVDAAQ